jgi:radical SAM superfamily enzyme YgiQ (UPF0313 family)
MSLTFRLRESSKPEDSGSIGVEFVRRCALAVGAVEAANGDMCDIELISVHHCLDLLRLSMMERTGGIRIVGGHLMAINPLPAIPYADVICCGEGESWVAAAFTRLAGQFDPQALRGLPGTLICEGFDGAVPEPVWEPGVPRHAPYLNRGSKGHDRTWYLELSRGCPFSCHYCALGNVVPYRRQNADYLANEIAGLDKSVSRKLSLLAADEASHPSYGSLLTFARQCGFQTMYGSVRADMVMKRDILFPKQMLLRIGIDGLTETTRIRVGKPITNDQVVQYFKAMTAAGHVNFKAFLVVGYPWETAYDVDEWVALWERVRAIRRETNAHVRIKITPLIPQPKTPLAGVGARYDLMVHSRLAKWVSVIASPRHSGRPGWFFEQDGTVMSRKNWTLQCRLVAGGIDEVSKCLSR